MRTLLTLLSLLFMSLAGCAEDGGPVPESEEEATFQDIEVKASETTGIIRGLVLTQSITPIEGATVGLLNQDLETTTNADGAFVFNDLEEGAYFLEVSKPGHNSTQTSVEVKAGVDKPEIVKVLLSADPGSSPFFEERQWKGYFTCSSAAIQVCPAVDLVLCIAGSCDILTDEFIVTVPIIQPPTWINSELVWESTQTLGEELDFYLEKVAKDDPNGWTTMETGAGPSPLLITVDEGKAASLDFGTTNDMRHRIFPALGPTSLVYVDQTFEVFSHVFYNYAPPEGWRFTDDPQVPSPPA